MFRLHMGVQRDEDEKHIPDVQGLNGSTVLSHRAGVLTAYRNEEDKLCLPGKQRTAADGDVTYTIRTGVPMHGDG
jgi:hypothetical protein